MLKDVRNVRVGLGSLLPILVRSHWLLIPDPMDRIIGDPDNFRGSVGSGISHY